MSRHTRGALMKTTLELVEDGHTRRATITKQSPGWLFRELDDTRVIREIVYTDWHRVERAMHIFELGFERPVHSTNR
jgi:hypothetical protein